MKIDIIIPFYNALDTIDKALASIVTQKLDDGDSILVTIVDDCSTECTYADIYKAISKWNSILAEFQCVQTTQNGGSAIARQCGLDYTNGDYVMFLDADDVLGSPFSVRSLCRELKKGTADFTMGAFIEETENGIETHGENFTWLHGKMFLREFIERFNIRFNDSRRNEDVGFNNLCRLLTSRITYINQVVYIWQSQNGSLVRTDRNGYAYDYGFRDFIYNLKWAGLEAISRRVNAKYIMDYSAQNICRLYYQFDEAIGIIPASYEANLNAIKELYEQTLSIFNPTMEYMKQQFEICNSYYKYDDTPIMSFEEYLNEIGMKGEK